MIGMPYYDEPLLSSLWPSNKTVCMMGHPPTTIDPEILAHVKTIDFVGYAPNLLHGKRRRYQAASDKSRQRGGKSGTRSTTRSVMPRFRSEQERDQRLQKQSVVQQSPSIISPTEALPSQVASAAGFPDYYRQVEIKYSRFGVEDFDFGFYNRTQYGGLETHIANSYCNSLLQSMFFTVCPNVSMLIFQEPLRRSIQWHMTLECSKEFCLCCELGFLFRMLEDAKGMNCQASNFLRSFATIPQGNCIAFGI
jgi:PAB-dependent poly(A)-specific ribonuclease subunit 2